MNKTAKSIIILLNIIMLILALLWYFNSHEYEPLIVVIGQMLSLLVIGYEKSFSNVSVKRVLDSEVKIKSSSDGTVKTKNIKRSKIDVEK